MKMQLKLVVILMLAAQLQNISAKPMGYSMKLSSKTEKLSLKDHAQLSDIDSFQGSGKSLLFPEDLESNVQLSFRMEDESHSLPEDKNGRYRFYKTGQSVPSKQDVISFPSGDPIIEARINDKDDGGSALSARKSGESAVHSNDNLRIQYEKFLAANKEDIQSLEALAFVIRQLLLREQVKSSNTSSLELPDSNVEVSTKKDDITLDVQEQSLYSGPKLNPQSLGKQCPAGTVRTRNGSCQKPSRKLVSQ